MILLKQTKSINVISQNEYVNRIEHSMTFPKKIYICIHDAIMYLPKDHFTDAMRRTWWAELIT